MRESIISRANAKLIQSAPISGLMGVYSGEVIVTYQVDGIIREKVITKEQLNSAYQKAKASYAEKL